MKVITFLLLLSVCITKIHTQETWELAKNKKGIKVYVSVIPNSDYYAVKIASLCGAILFSVDSYHSHSIQAKTLVGEHRTSNPFVSRCRFIYFTEEKHRF